MLLVFIILIGVSLVAGIILGIVNIVSGGKILGHNQSVGNYSDADDNCTMDFFDDSRGLPEIIVRHTATPSTITGRAASTVRTRTMTGMMTAMTDFGTREILTERFSEFQISVKLKRIYAHENNRSRSSHYPPKQ